MAVFRLTRKSLGAILIKRTVFFFLALCFLNLFLYGIGTRQEFMDSTQLLLLYLSLITGFFLAAGSLYGFFLQLWRIFHEKSSPLLKGAGMYLGLFLVGMGVALFAVFIIVFAKGNAD
jgi:hypothetical protein